jgi:hypothetical protein
MVQERGQDRQPDDPTNGDDYRDAPQDLQRGHNRTPLRLCLLHGLRREPLSGRRSVLAKTSSHL